MPYKLRKAPKRDLYWVIAQDGKHMSKDPIPKERAKAQIRALYASENQQKKGGALRGGATHKDRFERVISLLMDWIDAEEIAPILLLDVYNIAPRDANNELGEVNQQHLDAVRAYLQPLLDDNKMSDITDILDDDGVVVAGGRLIPPEERIAPPPPQWSRIFDAMKDEIESLKDEGILDADVADYALAYRLHTPPAEITQEFCDYLWNLVMPHIPTAHKHRINEIHSPADVGAGRGGNHHTLHGAGPLPELSILQQIAKAAYSTSPPQTIGPFKLRSATPTLKFYVLPDPDDQRHIDTLVVGIRGTNTSDKQDLYADAKLGLGQLEDTPRWKKDLADFNAVMSRLRDPQSVDVYGVGHSLGGAILDMFLKKGLIRQGVSYNPAISLGDAQKDIPNRRIYQDGDPLLAIMGRSAKNVEVRPKKVKEQSVGRKIANAFSYFIPYVGLVTKGMDTLDAHALDNFTGGYTSKITAKPDVIGRLEDIAVVKRSKGYWVYANDGETQESMRWGPFTKKVAEFEKRLLHQRQRHHLQPIAEEGEEGGMRGGTAVAMPKTLNDAWEEFKHHWKDRTVVNYNEFYGELKHIVRDIGGLTEPKATALIKVFRDQGWRKGLGAMGKIWEMVIDWEPKSLYAGGAVKKMTDQEMKMAGPTHKMPDGEVVPISYRPDRHIKPSITLHSHMKPEYEKAEIKPTPIRRRKGGHTGMGSAYLRQAKAKAKAYGLDPKKLKVATDGKHKLSYDGVLFGAMRYGDHLLWSAEEKAGRVPKGTAEKKRKAYRARAEKIKGEWKANKTSPNNLAIHILW